MLYFNIKPIIKARGIERPFSYLVKSGFPNHTAHNILNNKNRVLRLDHIERLCDILNCEPNDLMVWTPDSGKVYPENFALKALKNNTPTEFWKEKIVHLTYKELKESTKYFSQKDNQNPKD